MYGLPLEWTPLVGVALDEDMISGFLGLIFFFVIASSIYSSNWFNAAWYAVEYGGPSF